MGGGSSKIPDEQDIEIGQENNEGMNSANINLDMRSTADYKIMENFLQIHQGTLVGLVVVVVAVVVIMLLIYGFSRCWCSRIHKMCGATNEDNNDDTSKMEEGKCAEKRIMFKNCD